MRLGELKPPRGSHKSGKRLGQGTGSGTGKTAGRGHKGRRGSRTGFEGGQMPLHRRLPKIGFNNHSFRTTYQVVNLSAIEASGLQGVVGLVELRGAGLIRSLYIPVKILAAGELSRGVTVKAHAFSAKASEKIIQAGGLAEKLS